jgi:hypothetical protein
MRVDRRPSPHRWRGQAAPAQHRGGQAGDEVPADLCRRFADFRRTSKARTRVPNDLRHAVLDALDQGVSMLAVRRDLGLTAEQVAGWPRCALGGPVEIEGESGIEDSRVFTVADGPAVEKPGPTRSDADEALELRLGAWSIVVRRSCR